MHQTCRVIPPTFVTLDVGDLSSRETVSGPELSALGSAGDHRLVRRLLNPSFEKFEC